MAAEPFMMPSGSTHLPFRMPSSQAISPMSQPNPFENEMAGHSLPIGSERNIGRLEAETMPAIMMRKLPRHTSDDALRTMLLFAKDFVSVDFVSSDFPDEHGYLSAIARFRTSAAAHEARLLLDGKQNTVNEAPMIVEVIRPSPTGGLGPRRNTYDTGANRNAVSSSTASPGGHVARQSSRFNGTFQALDRISPPSGALPLHGGGAMTNGDLRGPTPYPITRVSSRRDRPWVHQVQGSGNGCRENR